MTLEELKAEANKQGYAISKKIVYEKLKPCTCGESRRIQQELTINPSGKYYYCKNCGRKSEIANSWYQARINWNKGV